MANRSFFSELRERKVVQAAAIYVAVAWGVTEILVTIVEQLFLPQWVSTLAVIFFVVGFPIAMFLSWTFDLTAEGIQRTEMASGRGKASIAFSIVLLVAGTAGLFLLIKPEIDNQQGGPDGIYIMPNSVAVLPFDFSGPDPDDSYLGSGLSDELRDQLGRVEGLGVAARTSSIAATKKGDDAKSMARLLGVSNLLEGSMRRNGNILTVSVALIDGETGITIWNESFRRGPNELLLVQQTIAEAVVRNVLPGSAQAVVKAATHDPTANELMYLARGYLEQALEREDMDPALLQRAVELYRSATEADPESALAFSRLAAAQMFIGDIDAAGVSAIKALELDPTLAEAHSAYGTYLFATGNERMGDELRRAIDLNPNLPEALHNYASWYWWNVSPDGVDLLFERALKLDRLNVARHAALGRYLALQDRYDDARSVVDQMIAMFDSPAAYRAIAEVLNLVGDVDHSIAWTIKARNAEPDNSLHVQRLAEYYTDIGDYETAQALEPDLGVGLLFKMRRYDEMIDKAEDLIFDYPGDLQLRTYLAVAYNATGRFDDALRMISDTGILETLAVAVRSTEEMSAFLAMVDAAYGSGEVEQARELMDWYLRSIGADDTANWWVAVQAACSFAILGYDDEVQRLLEKALKGRILDWPPILKDAQCWKRLADDPAYLAVIKHFDDLRAELRARLPDTLAEHGVSLN